MFNRHKYVQISESDLVKHVGPDTIASLKHDGAAYFLKINEDGSANWISRRESVHGGFPDKTDRLPHLASIKFPKKFAGNVINVELIHTGNQDVEKDSHRVVSGILNSLPARAAEQQPFRLPVHVEQKPPHQKPRHARPQGARQGADFFFKGRGKIRSGRWRR